MGITIERKKVAQNKSWLPFSTSVHGDFSFFLLNTPINVIQDGYVNRKKEKSALTVVGFLFLNHCIRECMEILFQQPKVGLKNQLCFWNKLKRKTIRS